MEAMKDRRKKMVVKRREAAAVANDLQHAQLNQKKNFELLGQKREGK